MSGEGEEDRSSRVYTIRGLDPELYERFVRTARELGVTVGDLMNMAMGDFLVSLEASKDFSQRLSQKPARLAEKIRSANAAALRTIVSAVGDFDLISDIEELTVTRADLESLERPVVFSNIKRLVFAQDVDWQLINSKVRSIKLVDEVVVGKGVPVLQLAKKCQLVKRIVTQG